MRLFAPNRLRPRGEHCHMASAQRKNDLITAPDESSELERTAQPQSVPRAKIYKKMM